MADVGTDRPEVIDTVTVRVSSTVYVGVVAAIFTEEEIVSDVTEGA